jgi:hypothetical protein
MIPDIALFLLKTGALSPEDFSPLLRLIEKAVQPAPAPMSDRLRGRGLEIVREALSSGQLNQMVTLNGQAIELPISLECMR